MALRKPHTKSKRGCFQCKKRHTKCSETKPICTSCMRLGVECNWPSPKNIYRQHLVVLSDPQIGPNYAGGSLGVSFDRYHFNALQPVKPLATDDMKLLHHWTMVTSDTLNVRTHQTKLWQSTIVDLGFRYPFLLRGVLALSAVHKASLSSTESSGLLLQSIGHMENALREFRNLLSDLDSAASAPMFALSCLLIPHHLGVGQVQEPHEPITIVIGCIHLIRGVSAILRPHLPRIMASDIAGFVSNAEREKCEGEVPEICRLKELVTSTISDGQLDRSRELDCIQAIDELHRIFIEVINCTPERSGAATVFIWPAVITKRFIKMISDDDPVALVILAHFGVLFRVCPGFWWMTNWDKRIIYAVKDKLAPKYHDWLLWPLKYKNEL